jgi:hypothetical protein
MTAQIGGMLAGGLPDVEMDRVTLRLDALEWGLVATPACSYGEATAKSGLAEKLLAEAARDSTAPKSAFALLRSALDDLERLAGQAD